MIADLKPYAEYKDSGQVWLGDIPQHWRVLPVRALFTEVIDRGHASEQMLSVTIKRGVITQAELLDNSVKRDSSNEDKSKYKLLTPGDIAYNKMRAWQGAFGVSGQRGIISPAYVVVRPTDISDSRYYHFLFRTPTFAKVAESWSYGIASDMWSLRSQHFRLISVPGPPIQEQAAIVKYLDRVTARLDAAIRAKRKVITLLYEQKQAIIHRAVTRGLDSSVPLKPSGIPWLGDIPQHWDLARPKQVLKSRSGGTVAIKNTASNEWRQGYVPAFSASGQDVWLPSPMFQGPGLVLSAVGARCGKTFKANGEWAVVANTHAFTVPEPHSSDYWWYVTNTKDWWVRSGSAQPFIQVSDSLNRRWVLPPPVEQKAIAAFLDKEVLRFDAAISHLEREIGLLREYCTRLMADVVTGKFDVREVSARLPDESPLGTVEEDSDPDGEPGSADEETIP